MKDKKAHNKWQVTEDLILEFLPPQPGAKTPTVEVRNRNSGIFLGTIKWWDAWGKFCFFPKGGRVLNVGCLRDIIAATENLKSGRQEC